MTELAGLVGSTRKALALVGLSRSSWHYRRSPRPQVADPVPQAQRGYRSRISDADRRRIGERITAGWARGMSVDQSFAEAWDAGVMLASRRSWWRIAAQMDEQLRPRVPTRRSQRVPRPVPVVIASRPNQAWSWDITMMRSRYTGMTFKAYKITDIYSREIVGWRVENREADHLAVEMFTRAIATRGAPEVVHADSGAAMTSTALYDYLDSHGVRMSHNRPYVSNDNPFSESGFRTMKYRPDYPRFFDDLEHARTYVANYVTWYNTEHRHSGIALFTPAEVGDGTWTETWHQRDRVLQDLYTRNPERFARRPITPTPATIVGINIPKNTTTDHNRLTAA